MDLTFTEFSVMEDGGKAKNVVEKKEHAAAAGNNVW